MMGDDATSLPDDVIAEVSSTMVEAFLDGSGGKESANGQLAIAQFRAFEKAYELGKRDHAR